mgnify:CR=1 FL=1
MHMKKRRAKPSVNPMTLGVGLLLAAVGVVTAVFTPSWTYGVDSANWTVDPNILLSDVSVPYAPNGIGSPSVVRDSKQNRLMMVFDYQSAVVNANCPGGVWGLGLATSLDGASWSVIDGNSSTSDGISPLYQPTPSDGTFRSCVTAHPSALWTADSNKKSMRVYYKAQQGTDACNTAAPSWGCNQYTGVGDMKVSFKGNGGVESVAHTANLDLVISEEFGYPNVIQRASDDQYVMLVQKKIPNVKQWNLYQTTSVSENSGWGSLALAQSSGPHSWNTSEVFSPDMMCMDDGSLMSFTGGRTLNASWAITEAGFSEATSVDDGATWTQDATRQFSWSGGNEWRHWTALRVANSDDYLIWWTEKNATTGHLQIRRAYTTSSWSLSGLVDDRCL